MGLFLKAVVVDDSGEPLASTIGQIYDINDTANVSPLAITTLNGTPFTLNQLVANNDGVIPDFIAPDNKIVKWVSGEFEMGLIAADLIPTGGTDGQILTKASTVDFDMEWADPLGVAPGGIDGQVLVKDGTDPYTTRWADAATGGSGSSASFPPGTTAFVRQTESGSWGLRPTDSDDVLVFWVGVDSWPAIVATGQNGPHIGDVFIEKRVV